MSDLVSLPGGLLVRPEYIRSVSVDRHNAAGPLLLLVTFTDGTNEAARIPLVAGMTTDEQVSKVRAEVARALGVKAQEAPHE